MNLEVFSFGLSYHSSTVSCIRYLKLSKSEVPQEILMIITVTGENEQFHYSIMSEKNCVLLKYFHEVDLLSVISQTLKWTMWVLVFFLM